MKCHNGVMFPLFIRIHFFPNQLSADPLRNSDYSKSQL